MLVLLFLTGAYPVWRAWQANRHTSLSHAATWMAAAWVAWGALLLSHAGRESAAGLDLPRYLALCLTGCAGVAVLGARRPGVLAWDFVVLGLLGVLLLPYAENLLAIVEPLGPLRLLFLAATLAVGILNYLPTRLGLGALALSAAVSGEMMRLDPTLPDGVLRWSQQLGGLALAMAPWLALWGCRLAPTSQSAFDQLWHGFRDRYGLVWGQRVREQFNRAAANAGWPVYLSWRGPRLLPNARPPSPELETAMTGTLRVLLKRFDMP
jgi:hypothetical protein